MSATGNSRKRGTPPYPSETPSSRRKRQPIAEDEELDDDVFLEEALLQYEEEDSHRRALTDRIVNWKRPKLSDDYQAQSRNIIFQQLEIDYYIGDINKELLPNSTGSAAIVRIFGVTEEGNSVCCNVHGFEPYFYISCPSEMGPDDIPSFHKVLEGKMREANRNIKVPKFVHRIELVQRQSIMYYQHQSAHPFLKIVVAHPEMVANCRAILDKAVQIDSLRMKSSLPYESDVPFALRFMIDCNIVGGNWIGVPHGKYKKTGRNLSYCQLEFDCLFMDLISHTPEGEFLKMAPFRILSFDIECAGRKGHFPDPTHDPVIQVANLVTLQGEDQPFVRNVMTLKSCSPIPGVDVMSFDTEKELLLAWMDFLLEVDPDIVIGYDICKFDLPYLNKRAKVLGIAKFSVIGRIRNSIPISLSGSRTYETSESKEITIEGRVQFDLLQVVQKNYNLSSYSLNSVSAHFLNEQKADFHHSIISDLQNGDSETRMRLAMYCLKGAYLPQRLFDKLMFIYNYVEMSRVTGVPFSFLLSRGQSIKVFSQLLRKAKQKNMVIPFMKQSQTEQGTYEGATVMEARAKFYDTPIATLDFASLYPSIMMAYNLCYCTLVTPEEAWKLNLPPECITKTPSGDTFVKSTLQKGILPEILEELLNARKRAKADLKEAKDPLVRAVLDGRQLALKISANSVYGFTGATKCQLPCLEISSSVTSYGRQMIEHTKQLVEEKFTIIGGYEHNAEVIYGDTDSVMVQFGVPSVEAAMDLGREAADYVSGTFIRPIKLEFEKIYYPYLLFSKKKYAGLYWTNPTKFDKIDAKGIETVRRDNCLLVKNLMQDCLNKILIDRDIPGAVQLVKNTISDLVLNRIDLSLLVITKVLTKTEGGYKVKAAHVEVAERMRKRDAATAPNVGDRVPYIIVQGAKDAKVYEKAEDPIYVLENNIPIDTHYYLEEQIMKPLARIFEPIKENFEKEVRKEIPRPAKSASAPSNRGIMQYVTKQLACIGCNALLSNSDRAICSHCKPREAELYCKSAADVADIEELFGRLWTQCQECQGSVHQDVLCTSRDCPIHYRRTKAHKDMAKAKQQLDRWAL